MSRSDAGPRRALIASRCVVGVVAALLLAACAGTGDPRPVVAVPPAREVAAEPAEEVNAFVACARRAKRREILLDTASRRLLQTVCGAALWFDGLFGERDVGSAQDSYGRVEVSTAYSEFEGSDTRVRFDARVKLPAMQKRLSLFVGLDDEEDFLRDRAEGHALRPRRRVSDRDAFLAGLGFVAVTTDRFQSEFKLGGRDVRQPEAFVQNRFSVLAYSDARNRLLLRLTPFWNSTDGYGATIGTAYDRAIQETFLLRWSNAGTVIRAGSDWRSAVILYQNLRDGSALGYEAFIHGATASREPLAEYGARTVLRVPVLEARLFLEFVLGYSWPRDDPALPREGAANAGVGIEMPFGVAPE